MGTRENYQRTLLAACYVLGDENALAARLRCSHRSVLDWLLGEVPVPTDVFLKAVDIVTESNGRFVESTAAFLEQVRKRNGF